MSSATMFILAVVGIALGAILVFIGGPKKAWRYLKENPRIAQGIIMFTLFGLILASFSQCVNAEEKGVWFPYAEVYLGLDQVKNVSPNCEHGEISDRLTSNGGIRLVMFTSVDERFEWSTKYTHHSCAFNEDRDAYDAIGSEVSYKFWSR